MRLANHSTCLMGYSSSQMPLKRGNHAGLIRKRHTYYIQFIDSRNHPSKKLHSLGTSRKDQARRKFVTLDRAYRDGHFDLWHDDPNIVLEEQRCINMSLREVAELFLEQKRRIGRSSNTVRTYRVVLTLLHKHLKPGIRLEKIIQSQLNSFIRDPSLSNTTQYKRYGHLRTFFRFCVGEKYMRNNPLQNVDTPDRPHTLPRAITGKELDLICEYIRQDYEFKLAQGYAKEGEIVWKIPAYCFAFYTGMRASEIARLRWKHIETKKSLIFIFE